MFFDKNDFLAAVTAQGLEVHAVEELRSQQDKDWVFLISHDLSNTGGPVELVGMAECFMAHGKLPVIFSPGPGPLSEYCENKRIPAIIVPDLLFGTFIDFTMHLSVLTVVNTFIGGSLIRRLSGNGHPVIWWIHESGNSYVEKFLVQMPEELEDNIHVYCVGEVTRRELLKKRPKYKTAILPIFVPEVSAAAGGSDLFPMIPKDKKVFLQVASLEKNKGQDILLEAVEKLEPEMLEKAFFVFIGTVQEQETRHLVMEKEKQYPDHFFLLDETDRAGVFELYRRADAVICSSRAESMPTVMAEGMMLSRLLICTTNAGISAFIREGNGGMLYQGEDTDALAGCLRKVITGDGSLEQYRQNAFKIYNEYFSKEVFDKNILAIEEQYCEKNDYRRGYRRPDVRKAEKSWPADITVLVRKSKSRSFSVKDLRDTVHSVCRQMTGNWNLILDEDQYETVQERLYLRRLRSMNTHIFIKTAGTEVPAGKYLLFMENGVTLSGGAAGIFMDAATEGSADLIYSDHEDIADGPKTETMHYKPDYAPDTLRSGNYIGKVFACRTELFLDAFGKESTGEILKTFPAYGLILRLSEKAKKVRHIPEVLWKEQGNGRDMEAERALDRECLEQYLSTGKFAGSVEEIPGTGRFHVIYEIKGQPLVSIIICNKDHYRELKTCIDSIKTKSTYPSYEIIISDNGTEDEETLAYYRNLKEEGVKIVRYWMPFNFPQMNNRAVKEAKGEYLVFLNNDTEVITPSWIEEMLMFCQRPDVGIVGGKLLFRDHTIQHAGVIIGLGGLVDHLYERTPDTENGYEGRLCCAQDLSCVTGACIMVRTALFREVGGFDERYVVTYNDIDLCLKMRERGCLVVWTPFAELFHDESKSRGYDSRDKRKQARCDAEAEIMRKTWKDYLTNEDPYYNPHLSLRDYRCEFL